MEGETQSSINAEMRFGERILPTLDNNIKSGNSLIDVDFYDGEIDFEPGTEKKIKPFSWEKAFPDVFKTSGFDVVIGNPPYRLMQPKDTDEALLKYFKSKFHIAEFKIDLFHLFYQKAITIIKKNGLLGFITPSSLLNNVYAQTLRTWLLDNTLIKIIALTKEKVFADADVYTAVYILQKSSRENDNNKIRTSIELEKAKLSSDLKYSIVKQKRFKETDGHIWNILINEQNVSLLKKIEKDSDRLKNISTINRGLITGDRGKYFSNKKVNDKYAPILAGGDIFRYYTNPIAEYVLFERPKTSGGCWDREVHFANHKIVIRQIGFKPIATLIESPIAVTGNIFTIRSENIQKEKLILAIINSKLIEYYWQIMFADFKNSFPQVTGFSLESIPIKKVQKDNKNLTEIIKQVDTILSLNKVRQQNTLPEKFEQIENRISHIDNKINRLIYELYGLTEEEIETVENN